MNAPDRLDALAVPDDIPKVTFRKDTKVENTMTFKLMREDHTLGNLLRIQLLRDERVRFAAYQHPHPLENDILLKIQAAPEAGVTPLQVLHDNVEELIKEVNLMSETFAHQLQIMKQHKEQTIGQ